MRELFDTSKILHLYRADIRQDADMWLYDLTELRNFAWMIAAQFYDRVFMVFFQATEREWQAEQIIIVLPASKGGETAGKYGRNGLFGAGFTDTTRYCNDGGVPFL